MTSAQLNLLLKARQSLEAEFLLNFTDTSSELRNCEMLEITANLMPL